MGLGSGFPACAPLRRQRFSEGQGGTQAGMGTLSLCPVSAPPSGELPLPKLSVILPRGLLTPHGTREAVGPGLAFLTPAAAGTQRSTLEKLPCASSKPCSGEEAGVGGTLVLRVLTDVASGSCSPGSSPSWAHTASRLVHCHSLP